MAIIEEPFSIWRLVRSWFRESRSTGRSDQSGDEARGGDPTVLRRGQLLEARQKAQHQIDLLQYGVDHGRGGPSQNPMLIAELRRALEQIDADLRDQQTKAVAEPDDPELLAAVALGDPTILSGLNFTVTDSARAEDGALWVERLLVCQECVGGDMFSLLSFQRPESDPWSAEEEGPEETAHLPPWSVRCIECGFEKTIFDPRSAGRARVRYGVSGDEPGPDEPRTETGAATVYVRLIYHAELDALMDEAAEASVPAADLFDEVYVRGVSPNGEDLFKAWQVCS